MYLEPGYKDHFPARYEGHGQETPRNQNQKYRGGQQSGPRRFDYNLLKLNYYDC